MKYYFLILLSLMFGSLEVCGSHITSQEGPDDLANQVFMQNYLRGLSGSSMSGSSIRQVAQSFNESPTQSQLLQEMDELRVNSEGVSVRVVSPEESRQVSLSPTVVLMGKQEELRKKAHEIAKKYMFWFIDVRSHLQNIPDTGEMPSADQVETELQELEQLHLAMRDNDDAIRKSYQQVREIVDDVINNQ